MKITDKLWLLILLGILFLATLAYGSSLRDNEVRPWQGIKPWAGAYPSAGHEKIALDSEQWEDGNDPYFVDKSTLSLTDVYTNPGVSLVDPGATNFQESIHSWVPSVGNRVYTVLDGGVSVLAVERVNSSAGGINCLRDSYDLTTDLTVGSLYLLTAQVKVNIDSSNIQVNKTSPGIDYVSRDIVETEWTGVSIPFTAYHSTGDVFQMKELGAGETIFIKEWDLRELDSRSVLGDEEGDPELVVDGIFSIDLLASSVWGDGADWLISGSSAHHVPGTASFFYQSVGIEQGLFKIRWTIRDCTAGTIRAALSNGGFLYGPTHDADGDYTDYMFCSEGNGYIYFYGNGPFNGAIDNISVQRINTAWTPYDANTLALSADSGISVTYVDNGSGASNFLTAACDLATDPASGEWQRYTCNARINTGDCVLHIRASDGGSKANYSISSTDSESVQLDFISGASDYIDFVGLGAGEEVWTDDHSLKELTRRVLKGWGVKEKQW